MNRKKTRSRSKADRRSLLTGLAFISVDRGIFMFYFISDH